MDHRDYRDNKGSADLGGRVGWLPKAERVKTLFLSPLQPQNAGGWGGGGERGGIPASGPGPKVWRPGPQAPWRPGPLGPGSRSYRLTSCMLRLKLMGPGLKTPGCYHNPQSADLGGRCMVSEGYSPTGPGPKPLETWPTSP